MRFEVVHSNLVENGWFIKDKVGKLTFPTSTNLNDLFCYCRALNKLCEERRV